jgi:hypothetical protein
MEEIIEFSFVHHNNVIEKLHQGKRNPSEK